MKIKKYLIVGLLPLALAACGSPNRTTETTNVAIAETSSAGQPLIEAAPVSAGEGDYKFITGDDFKLTVRAANASEVELYYQPVTAEDRALKLKTLTAPAEGKKDSFVADLKIPEDFNGECSSRVRSGNRRKRRKTMIWTILVILLVLWVLGFIADVAGGLIHLLLVAAAVVLVVKFVTGRRAA